MNKEGIIMQLKLKDIRIDGGTQSRDIINVDVIDGYVECYENGDRFPPIEVFYDGISYYLVDGYHRYFMYQKLNIETIDVKVFNGTIRDAQKYSLGVNDKHGLPRTHADKRKAVMTAFDDMEWSEYSDREIAKLCSVSNAFVGKLRKELMIERPAIKEITKNGKKSKMDTSNIGKKEEPEYNPLEDEIKNLASVNQDLYQENLSLKDTKMVLLEDEKKVVDELSALRKQIKVLEAELQIVKNSRDQFQNKNAELIKEVNYWRNKCRKLEK